jgi:hypothetical protein
MLSLGHEPKAVPAKSGEAEKARDEWWTGAEGVWPGPVLVSIQLSSSASTIVTGRSQGHTLRSWFSPSIPHYIR